MRKLYIPVIIVIAFCLQNCSTQGPNVQISGKLKTPMPVKVLIADMDVEQLNIIDSTKCNDNGEFSIGLTLGNASLYMLQVGPRPIYLVLKPGDRIAIDIDNTLDNAPYYIQGSTDSRLVQEVITAQERVLDEITAISIEYEKSKANPQNFVATKSKLDSNYAQLLMQHKNYTDKIIRDNPNSLACIFALYQNFGKTSQPLFDKYEDIEIFNFVDSNLSLHYPETPAVKALNRDLTEIKQQLEHKKYSEELIVPGKKAPAFSITTTDSSFLPLSELNGYAVVYFFFAVWNEESVKLARQLNTISNKYKYRKLKVIGISFDTSEEKLKAFINSENMSFPIACDYKFWDSDYVKQFGVRKIPDIILLSPEHFIVNRAIGVPELNTFLEEWRKNGTI